MAASAEPMPRIKDDEDLYDDEDGDSGNFGDSGGFDWRSRLLTWGLAAAALLLGDELVVEKVKSLKGNEGLNAATGVYEDLVKLGVIDAAKVTRSALQNAASIAALFLTTEAVVADKPEGDGGGMPGGGMEDF